MTYTATLDVPRAMVQYLARLLAAERWRRNTPRNKRKLTPYRQAVLVLRWFRQRADAQLLARDNGLGQATVYRYLHEGIDVLADHAPDLHEVLQHCRTQEMTHVILDGKLICTDRVAERTPGSGCDLWYSGKHHTHGGTIQVVTDPKGQPLWVSDVCPGSTHDLTAARELALPALYAHARTLPVLADKGYVGAGTGIHTPIKEPAGSQVLHEDNRAYNALLNGLRALGERAHAVLTQRWRALQHITLDPSRIGDIARAALTLIHFEQPQNH